MWLSRGIGTAALFSINLLKFNEIMKQKSLTEKQKEILKRLNALIDKAVDEGIGFVYDMSDCSLTAYNNENVCEGYSGRHPEGDDEQINYDDVLIIDQRFDFFDSERQYYFLHMEEENKE